MHRGIVNPSEGSISVDGHDIVTGYRAARSMIGLVPQELATDMFETVWATVSFSRGLFGRAPNPQHIHVVVRTPNGNDYGKDLLRQHYLLHPHGAL